MTKVEIVTEALKLPMEEQLELAQRLWENAAPPADHELTAELKELLEARRAEALAHPEDGISWEEAKARILEGL